jgi:predicted DNA binding protein
MATIAEFTVQADAFPLGTLFQECPDVQVELERVVPTKPTLIPYIWIRELSPDDVTQLVAAANEEPFVRSIKQIDEVNGAHLLRLEWETEIEGLLQAITEMDGTLISATGTAEAWTFEIRSDTHAGITELQETCRDHEIPISLTSLRAISSVEGETDFGLTDAQRDALVLAYTRGYYQSPREVTLETLANEFGITAQAFGSRLRRGVNRLIESTLSEAD